MIEALATPFRNRQTGIPRLLVSGLLAAALGCIAPPEDKTEEPGLEEYVVTVRPKVIKPSIPLGSAAPDAKVEAFRRKGSGSPDTYLPFKIVSKPSVFTASLPSPNSNPTTLRIQAVGKGKASVERLTEASWRGTYEGQTLASDYICVDLSIGEGSKNIKSGAGCTNVTAILDEAAKELLPEIQNKIPWIRFSRDVIPFPAAKVGVQTVFIEFNIYMLGIEGKVTGSLQIDPPSEDFSVDDPLTFSLMHPEKTTHSVGVRFQPTSKGFKTANLKILSSAVKSPVNNITLRGVGE